MNIGELKMNRVRNFGGLISPIGITDNWPFIGFKLTLEVV